MNSSHTNAPGCEAGLLFTGRQQQPSPVASAALIFIIIIQIITFPFTVVLNALVIIAVKVKPRLRRHKSNILLALLASTDFMVGAIIQPTFIAVLVMFLLDRPSVVCLLAAFRVVMISLTFSSLLHVALISGERYLAIKQSFAYPTLVTEARLLVASALAWLLSGIFPLPLAAGLLTTMYLSTLLIGLVMAFIVFCQVTVYRETRRHEQQIAVLQVTQEAREQFLRDKKALKLTSIIIMVLIMFYMPMVVVPVIISRDESIRSLEALYVFLSSCLSLSLFNSLFNPIMYSVRTRQFRVAFVELICRTVDIAEAEELEMRVFGAPNAVTRLEARQEHEEQNAEQANVHSDHKAHSQQAQNGELTNGNNRSETRH